MPVNTEGASIFQPCAYLRQSLQQLWPLMLSIRRTIYSRPARQFGVLMAVHPVPAQFPRGYADTSFTDLKQGEHPIETLQGECFQETGSSPSRLLVFLLKLKFNFIKYAKKYYPAQDAASADRRAARAWCSRRRLAHAHSRHAPPQRQDFFFIISTRLPSGPS